MSEKLTVFISFWRDDAHEWALATRYVLADHYGWESVYLDFSQLLDDFPYAADPPTTLRWLRTADVCIPIIGAKWLDQWEYPTNPDERNDVLLQLREALRLKVHILPVCTKDAPVLDKARMPEIIQGLLDYPRLTAERDERFGKTLVDAVQQFEGKGQNFSLFRLRKSEPPPPRWGDYLTRGDYSFFKKDMAGALSDYNKALEMAPKRYHWLINESIAQLHIAQGEIEKAKGKVEESLRDKPHYLYLRVNRGYLRSEAGDLEGALGDYTEAIRRDPQLTHAYVNRAYLRKQLGDIQGALADFDTAIRQFPSDAVLYNDRGITRASVHDYHGAISDYTESIRLNPAYTLPYMNRAIARKNLKDFEGALADSTEAIQRDPSYADAYLARANTHYAMGNFALALADCDTAIRINPESAIAFTNRGVFRHKMGDSTGALADYNKAILLDPAHVTAYNNRGELYKESGQISSALSEYNKAIRLAPSFETAYYNRGKLYADSYQDFAAALRDYEQYLALNGENRTEVEGFVSEIKRKLGK